MGLSAPTRWPRRREPRCRHGVFATTRGPLRLASQSVVTGPSASLFYEENSETGEAMRLRRKRDGDIKAVAALDAETTQMVHAMAQLHIVQIPRLEEGLYAFLREFSSRPDFSEQPADMQIGVLAGGLNWVLTEISRPGEFTVDGTLTDHQHRYRPLIVEGAHSLASRDGYCTLMVRLVDAARGQLGQHSGEPLRLAQWLTWYNLYALICGAGEGPYPNPQDIGLVEGLVSVFVAAGDDVRLR